MKSSPGARIFTMFKIQVTEFSRDFGGIFLSFAFPFMFIASLLATSIMNPVVKFKFGIVDEFQNPQAQVLVNAITATPSVETSSVTREKGISDIKEGLLNAVVVVPNGEFQDGRQPLELIVDDRYQPISDVILQATVARMEASKNTEHVRYKVVSPGENVQSEFTFVFPGILAMALLQMGLFVTAVPMLQARDRGTYRYLSLTPLSIPEFLASQIAFRYLIGFTQISLLVFAGSFTLKLSLLTLLSVFAVSAIGVLMMVSIGYLIAGTAPSLQVGMAMVMVAEFGMIFGGNVFWNTNTSDVLFYVAHIVPLSYLADMFRQVITGSPGVWPLWVDGVAIIGWSLLALLLMIRKFRFDAPMNSNTGNVMQLVKLGSNT